jgi:hypothetical protein
VLKLPVTARFRAIRELRPWVPAAQEVKERHLGWSFGATVPPVATTSFWLAYWEYECCAPPRKVGDQISVDVVLNEGNSGKIGIGTRMTLPPELSAGRSRRSTGVRTSTNRKANEHGV